MAPNLTSAFLLSLWVLLPTIMFTRISPWMVVQLMMALVVAASSSIAWRPTSPAALSLLSLKIEGRGPKDLKKNQKCCSRRG